MPHKTNLELRGVHWQFFGVVTFGEIMAANQEIWDTPSFSDFRFQIVDFLNVEKLDLKEEQAAIAAYMDKAASKSCPRMKVALVADSTDSIELCNTYIASLDEPGWEAQIFNDLAAANQWAKS